MRRTLLALAAVFGGLAAVTALSLFVLVRLKSEPLPSGVLGVDAQDLAGRIEKRVGVSEFRQIAAIGFSFRGQNHHFCDLRRRFSEVRWLDSGDEWVVRFSHASGQHIVLRNHNPVHDPETRREAYSEAFSKHVNDYFWLNPLAALRAPGSELRFVGTRALLVTYRAGGLTPGDSYLIVTDRNYRPEYVRMWVRALPIPGIKFTFEEWKKFAPGFEVSLKHRSDLAEVNLTNVVSLPLYPEPGGPDRFRDLIRHLKEEPAGARLRTSEK